MEILQVHSRNKKLAEGVDLMEVALRTPGFAGANLMNLLNEAAILAGRRGLTVGRLVHRHRIVWMYDCNTGSRLHGMCPSFDLGQAWVCTLMR